MTESPANRKQSKVPESQLFGNVGRPGCAGAFAEALRLEEAGFGGQSAALIGTPGFGSNLPNNPVFDNLW